jgi:hypothetical protein
MEGLENVPERKKHYTEFLYPPSNKDHWDKGWREHPWK